MPPASQHPRCLHRPRIRPVRMHNASASFAAMLAQQPLPLSYAPDPYMTKDTSPSHLYLHQQRTVEVIQLIEVPPPPPRSHPLTSTYASTSLASSSCDSTNDDSGEDESGGSSYCSSEDDLDVDHAPPYDDTYKTRLSRVLAWREGFVKAVEANVDETLLRAPPSSPVSSSPAPSLKRKADSVVDSDSDDETSSQSSHYSKRSRSLPPEERAPPAFQQCRLSAHSCSACDASFNTIQSLRQHGNSGLNDACREAVQYGFEP